MIIILKENTVMAIEWETHSIILQLCMAIIGTYFKTVRTLTGETVIDLCISFYVLNCISEQYFIIVCYFWAFAPAAFRLASINFV